MRSQKLHRKALKTEPKTLPRDTKSATIQCPSLAKMVCFIGLPLPVIGFHLLQDGSPQDWSHSLHSWVLNLFEPHLPGVEPPRLGVEPPRLGVEPPQLGIEPPQFGVEFLLLESQPGVAPPLSWIALQLFQVAGLEVVTRPRLVGPPQFSLLRLLWEQMLSGIPITVHPTQLTHTRTRAYRHFEGIIFMSIHTWAESMKVRLALMTVTVGSPLVWPFWAHTAASQAMEAARVATGSPLNKSTKKNMFMFNCMDHHQKVAEERKPMDIV